MSTRAAGGSPLAYLGALGVLALALAFPIGLMIFNPTLMFERGWEQYLGTSIYFWAVLMLGRETLRLRRNERAFDEAENWLDSGEVAEGDERVLASRFRQLARHSRTASPSAAQLMEINREGSGLDQEHTAARFALPKYILYLLPVIGFIGTVEGISKALMNISRVLPMVKELDGFLNNLTSVTSALQIAFDSTLLALFLSAALMLVQTIVTRRAEDLLARVDRWVVEQALPRLGKGDTPTAALNDVLAPHLERIGRDLAAHADRTTLAIEALSRRLDEGLGVHVGRFAEAVDKLPPAVTGLQQGAEAIGRFGDDLDGLNDAGESLRRGVLSLSRIEDALAHEPGPDEQLEQIRRGVDRTCVAIESLSGQWANAFERSSRATQEQLARTLNSLKDALDLLNVSMEQGNSLYRNIVKKMLPIYNPSADDRAA